MDRTYYFKAPDKVAKPLSLMAFLLSIYDECIIACKDRRDLGEAEWDIERLISMVNALTAVIVRDGKVAGIGERAVKKGSVEIKLSPSGNYLGPRTRRFNQKSPETESF